jgi:hypothetical protein
MTAPTHQDAPFLAVDVVKPHATMLTAQTEVWRPSLQRVQGSALAFLVKSRPCGSVSARTRQSAAGAQNGLRCVRKPPIRCVQHQPGLHRAGTTPPVEAL